MLAPNAGTERAISAAQATLPKIRSYTAKTLFDSARCNNALMVNEFKKDVDRSKLTIPMRDSGWARGQAPM